MYIIELPFSMGKMISYNPQTYEYEVDHPILAIGSSSSGLKYEVKVWLDVRCPDYVFGINSSNYFISFPTLEDATAFKLVWI